MRVSYKCTLRSEAGHTVYYNRGSLSESQRLCDNGSESTESYFECCSRKSVRPSWQTQTCHADPLFPPLFHTLSHTHTHSHTTWCSEHLNPARCSIALQCSLFNPMHSFAFWYSYSESSEWHSGSVSLLRTIQHIVFYYGCLPPVLDQPRGLISWNYQRENVSQLFGVTLHAHRKDGYIFWFYIWRQVSFGNS